MEFTRVHVSVDLRQRDFLVIGALRKWVCP